MTEVKVTKAINVPANKVWEKVSSFRGIEEFSPIARSVVEGEGVGANRMCYMEDGAEISERLEVVDTNNLQIQYKIVEGPFPITDYLSTVTVKPTGDNTCEVTWGSTFSVGDDAKEDMVNLFNGFYNVIIDSLEGLISGQN